MIFQIKQVILYEEIFKANRLVFSQFKTAKNVYDKTSRQVFLKKLEITQIQLNNDIFFV